MTTPHRLARPSHKSRTRLAAAAAAAAILLPFGASADTRTYVGPATGTFSFGSNWSPAGVPGPDDDALIAPAAPTSPYSITFNTSAPYKLNSFTLNSPSEPLTFNLYPSYLTQTAQITAGYEIVGSSGNATLVQSNQANLVSTLSIADSPGSFGTYRLNGGLLAADTQYVGRAGAGTFSLAGGTLAATNLYLADAPGASATFTQGSANNLSTNVYLAAAAGSSATYTLSSSSNTSLSHASLYVGYGGSATLSQSSGTVGRFPSPSSTLPTGASSSSLILGYNPGSSGTYLLSNGTVYGALTYVGYSGAGSFVQNSGYHVLTHSPTGTVAGLYLGYNPGSSGSYSLSAGTLATSSLYVGYSGAGTFTQSGHGGIYFNGYTGENNVYVGYNPGSSGTFSLSPSSPPFSYTPILGDNNVYVGFAGDGTFVQSTGSHAVSGSLFLAYAPGSTGLYSLTAGTFHSSTLYVGYNGAGTFSQSAGSVYTTGGLYIGSNASPGSAYLLSGTATLTNSSTLTVGNTAPGTFVQSGGSVAGDGSLYIGCAAPGSYTLSAGTLSAGSEHIGYNSGSGTFIQTGGTHTAASIYLADSPYLFSRDTASYSLSAGSLHANYETIGQDGPANFTQTGGTHAVAYTLNIGNSNHLNPGDVIYTLSDGTLSASNEQFGYLSTPTTTFLQTGGTHSVGAFYANAGRYALSGGTLSIRTVTTMAPAFSFSWTAGTLALGTYTINTDHAVNSLLTSPLTLVPARPLSTQQHLTNPASAAIHFDGGTLDGPGGLTNAGSIDGYGTLATTSLSNSGSIALSGNANLASASITNAGSITLSGGASLSAASLTNSGSITLSGGTHLLSGPLDNTSDITLQDAAATFSSSTPTYNRGALTLSNSSASFPAGLIDTASSSPLDGTLIVDANSSLAAKYISQAAVACAGSITLLSAVPFAYVGTLDLAPTAKFDIANNALSITGTDLDTVRQYLRGGQLFSSATDATHSLRIITFSNSSRIWFNLALTGDANVDRKLTADDYAILDRSYARGLTNAGWTDGDFNYDGLVDQQDYFLLDTAYCLTHGISPGLLAQRDAQFGSAYVSSLLASVPEPSCLFVLLLSPFLRRRR